MGLRSDQARQARQARQAGGGRKKRKSNLRKEKTHGGGGGVRSEGGGGGGRRSVLLLTGSSKLCDRRLHLRSGQFERSGVFWRKVGFIRPQAVKCFGQLRGAAL